MDAEKFADRYALRVGSLNPQDALRSDSVVSPSFLDPAPKDRQLTWKRPGKAGVNHLWNSNRNPSPVGFLQLLAPAVTQD